MPFSLTSWLGFGLVGCFVIYKFILLPIMNEGQPIDPPQKKDGQENKDTFFGKSLSSEDIISTESDPFQSI